MPPGHWLQSFLAVTLVPLRGNCLLQESVRGPLSTYRTRGALSYLQDAGAAGCSLDLQRSDAQLQVSSLQLLQHCINPLHPACTRREGNTLSLAQAESQVLWRRCADVLVRS